MTDDGYPFSFKVSVLCNSSAILSGKELHMTSALLKSVLATAFLHIFVCMSLFSVNCRCHTSIFMMGNFSVQKCQFSVRFQFTMNIMDGSIELR